VVVVLTCKKLWLQGGGEQKNSCRSTSSTTNNAIHLRYYRDDE